MKYRFFRNIPIKLVSILCAVAFYVVPSYCQVRIFPYAERFDSVSVPSLPAGWLTSTRRSSAGDFVTSSSGPHSSPNTLYSLNSTVPQFVVSPIVDFTIRIPDKLQFYVSRSSSHTSGLVVEASIDSGATYPMMLGDTLWNPGTTAYVLESIALPASLANQPLVRFRWRLIGGTGGTSGTIRIDDISVSTVIMYDLAMTGSRVVPSNPTSLDTLTLAFTVRNAGRLQISTFAIDVFQDRSGDSLFTPDERVGTFPGNPLMPEDSSAVIIPLPPMKPGTYKFAAVARFPLDEIPADDTTYATVVVGYPRASILINEIMYAPAGDEPEWVELVNPSADTVDLRNWRISDNNTANRGLLTPLTTPIPPLGFAIVTKDPNFSILHPSTTCPVMVSAFGALNNTTPDAVVVYDFTGRTSDSVWYSPNWGGKNGHSLERVDVDQPSSDSTNWGSSVDSLGATPGRRNSIARLPIDFSLARLFEDPSSQSSGSRSIDAVVRNVGKQRAGPAFVRLFADPNQAGEIADSDLVGTGTCPALGPMDSAAVHLTFTPGAPGEVHLIASVDLQGDERNSNNTLSIVLRSSFSPASLIINEIMFDPPVAQPEWVELYNRSGKAIDLKGWNLVLPSGTTSSTSTYPLSRTSLVCAPNGYVVLTADSSLMHPYSQLDTSTIAVRVIVLNRSLGLGNTGDIVIVQDLAGTTVDSVAYSPTWHASVLATTKGKSLERINPDLPSNDARNWSSCTAASGGTPGLRNSIFTLHPPSSATLSFSPNPFSPDGDGHEDFCVIHYRVPGSAATVTIRLYDIRGRLIRTLASSELTGSEGDIIWDGMEDNRQRARIGPYIAFLESTDLRTHSSSSAKGVVVVATFLSR